jgi:hypothetical protein
MRSSFRGALVALAFLVGGCGGTAPGRPLALGPVAKLPSSARSHVVVMVMENAEYGEALEDPHATYLRSLVHRYGLATRSYAIAHPSLPNYLALTSGSTHGITSDCTDCGVSAPNIVDELEGAKVSWSAYLEEIPHPCFAGAGAGGYARKHDPFIYYADVARSKARCSHLVGFPALATALRAGRLPTFAWITPNLCDDGHDCGASRWDAFLERTVPALLHALGPNGFLVLTWDEGSSDAGCCGEAHGGHILTVVAGPGVRRGARETAPVDHYGVLRTIEQALGLAPLAGAADPRAGTLAPLFVGGTVPRVRG